MSVSIQGLSCASCQQPIVGEGVVCSACRAIHHGPCYQGAGHCASCQNAKAPTPFGVIATGRGEPLSRTHEALRDWLKNDVVPYFRATAPDERSVDAGDRVWIGPDIHGPPWSPSVTMAISLAEPQSVQLQGQVPGTSNRVEIMLPRAFLPAVPAPAAGDVLGFEWERAR